MLERRISDLDNERSDTSTLDRRSVVSATLDGRDQTSTKLPIATGRLWPAVRVRRRARQQSFGVIAAVRTGSFGRTPRTSSPGHNQPFTSVRFSAVQWRGGPGLEPHRTALYALDVQTSWRIVGGRASIRGRRRRPRHNIFSCTFTVRLSAHHRRSMRLTWRRISHRLADSVDAVEGAQNSHAPEIRPCVDH